MSDIISIASLIGFHAVLFIAVAGIARALRCDRPRVKPDRPALPAYQGRTGYFNDPS